jgi:putative Mg2+ transporter-C (MgtC) family protein
MPVHKLTTAARLLLAFILTFALGFERELRGSPAGDRTFSLIGVGTAVIGVLAERTAPNALAGAVTGIGFIGAGVVFRHDVRQHAVVRGITTAAAIFCASAIGAAAGEGRPLVAVTGTLLVLLSLEVRYLPGLRILDARRWAPRFSVDEDTAAGTPQEGQSNTSG